MAKFIKDMWFEITYINTHSLVSHSAHAGKRYPIIVENAFRILTEHSVFFVSICTKSTYLTNVFLLTSFL